MLAILPDIHANRPALQAVLADAHIHGACRFAALGDIIGFGGEPAVCAECIRSLKATTVRGNHEAALRSPSLFSAFPAVQRMTERTRNLLPPLLFTWLTNLPCTAEMEGIPLTHATFHEPDLWGRLKQVEEAALSFAATGQAPLAFFGHTHRPTLFCMNRSGVVEKLPIVYDTCGSFNLTLEVGKRYLVNPGSVGQPRDGDPRAAYALWDAAQHRLTLRRVVYDVEAAAASTRSIGLPEIFAATLKRGISPL